MKERFLKRALAWMLAMALVLQGFASVGVSAAEGCSITDVKVTGNNSSGYTVSAKVTNTDTMAHKYTVVFTPKLSNGNAVSHTYEINTERILAGDSAVITKSGLSKKDLTGLDYLGNGEDSGWQEYYVASVEADAYVMRISLGSYDNGTVTGELIPKSDGTYDMVITSTKALNSVAVIFGGSIHNFTDLGGVKSYTENLTFLPADGNFTASLHGATYGAYEEKGYYTNLHGAAPITFDELGYGSDGNGHYYYYFDLTNTDDTRTLSSVTVTGTFTGMSSVSLTDCGLGPGESGRFKSALITSSPSSMNEYSLVSPVLMSEEAPSLDGIQDPKVTTTNVGNKCVVWAKVKFGKYYISGSTAKEDIYWRVLKVEGNQAIIMADQAIVDLPYTSTWGNTKWEDSYARSYLNNEFLNDAFTASEQSSIANSTVSTAVVDGSKAEAGEPTTDKVYILGLEELKDYKLLNGTGATVPARQIKMSKYVKDNLGSDATYASYFLRNPGYFQYDVVGVTANGKAVPTGWRAYAHATVVPVMKVAVSALFKDSPSDSTFAKISDGDEAVDEASISAKINLRKLAVKGDKVVKSNISYTVTNAYDSEAELPEDVVGGAIGENTVTVTSVKKGATSVTIPSTVTIDGQTFKVTGISKGAFKAAKSTLKTIKVSSKNLKSVNKNAFSGVKATTTIKTNSSNYSKVKKAVKSSKTKAKVKK